MQERDMIIGRSVRHAKCYVLDAKLRRAPLGVAGELHVGGLGISRGYLNREKLTRDNLYRIPFNGTGARGRHQWPLV